MPTVVESWRDGAAVYDAVRLSWEEPGVDRKPVVLRSFLTRGEADKWVERIEMRQAMLTDAHGAQGW